MASGKASVVRCFSRDNLVPAGSINPSLAHVLLKLFPIFRDLSRSRLDTAICILYEWYLHVPQPLQLTWIGQRSKCHIDLPAWFANRFLRSAFHDLSVKPQLNIDSNMAGRGIRGRFELTGRRYIVTGGAMGSP
jgi:hypothetical protein